MSYKLGIDVGGTNTDAVILDKEDRVMAKCKRPTTEDVSGGIREAVDSVLKEAGVESSQIVHAMLGTTHATNAIVERKGLSRIGVIRLCVPAGVSVPPYLDWPVDIVPYLGNHYEMVRGGYEFNGKLLSQPEKDEIRRAIESLRKNKIEALAVSSVFAPVNNEQELLVKEIAVEVLERDFPVSLSHEIGTIGILERENATILNAAILKIADSAYGSFQDVLKEHGVKADLFITQNDGTLMSVDYARMYPVFTIASGPTNSLRGAAFLSGIKDAVVVDVGGTTTDVGILKNGFPRESTQAMQVGGVRTNFRMPDLIAIGLGGGSLVKKEQESLTVGPESVGYRITQEALIFGGKTLTATDIAVASGLTSLGDEVLVSKIDRKLVERASQRIREMVEEVIDKMKTTSEDVPVVIVGGGSILLPEKLKGASRVSRPRDFDVANAIGAAISQVSGSIDGVYDVATKGRESVIEEVKEAARKEALKAGADVNSIEIVDLEEIPLAYLPSNAVRFRVKAVGNLTK
ncbi:MAG: hydantoinase/oxoprolinase family protein [Spirochaetota bacterium]|nr:MAG: hydantoinase/oxoprolinase family protein [Spirochaetota bacterium]